MREQQGKFVLFDVTELARWLHASAVHRQIRLVQNHHTFLPSYQHFDGTNHFDKLTGMEHSGRVDMDAFAGEDEMDDEETWMPERND